MASLNTLRTKFGVVLSVLIGLALLAFVLSLKTEMGFSGNDPKVGVIDGQKIKYSEYLEQYDRVKAQSGATEGDARQTDMLADATWQALVARHVLEPGFERMGITVGEQERLGMLSGDYYSPVFYQIFADPRTGQYNVAAVSDFLSRAESDPRARQAWNFLNEQALLDRAVGKYYTLLKNGVYANSLEVAQGMQAANNAYSGRWARRKYASLPDSLFAVSASEIRSYYKAHKDRFRQLPSRTLSYVVFDVNPTDDDMLALEHTVREVGDQFAAAGQVRPFVRANRNGRISDQYVSAAQLTDEEAQAFAAGRQYGPVLKNNVWTMARVVDTRMAPDTLGIRHIVLPYNEEKLADSLLTALRGGADFAEAARSYSVYDATAAQGGEVGLMPFSAFPGEFVDALAGARKGDIVKVAAGDAIQLIQIYRADVPTRHFQVATITYPVEASADTRRAMHNAAGSFSVKAKGSVAQFNEAASDAAVTPRVATLTQGERQLRGLEDSRDLVRWAYGAEKGAVSEIFTVDGDYVVAMVTDIDDAHYASLDKVTDQIRHQLLLDKKYDYIMKDVSGTTYADLTASVGTSEVAPFENLTYATYYINSAGLEPRLVGAITSVTEEGAQTKPVKGATGVYVFQVNDIVSTDTQTPEAEQVRIQAFWENMIPQQAMQAMQQMAEVEDLRGRYF